MMKAMCVCFLLIQPAIGTFSDFEGAIIAIPQDKLNWFQIALVKSVFMILVIQWLSGTLPVVVSLPLKNFVLNNKLDDKVAAMVNITSTIPPPPATQETLLLDSKVTEKPPKPADTPNMSRRRLEVSTRKAFHLFHIAKRVFEFIYAFVSRYIRVVPGFLRLFRFKALA